MPIYDITVPLSNEMPTYPGDPGIRIKDWYSLANGDPANVTHLNLGAHTGTHVDAPAHFIEGATRSALLSLDSLIGVAQVIEVPDSCLAIDKTIISEQCDKGTDRFLFKTRNSAFWKTDVAQFRQDFTYLELDAAQLLVDQGVRLVGIDYLSIEQFGQKEHPTHLALLSHGAVIVEGLNLSDVSAGFYELVCLPMLIQSGKGDGAPARAILRTID